MDVLQLSDGSVEIIADKNDFSELIERKLGFDVKRWFESYIEKIQLECESYIVSSSIERQG